MKEKVARKKIAHGLTEIARDIEALEASLDEKINPIYKRMAMNEDEAAGARNVELIQKMEQEGLVMADIVAHLKKQKIA